MANTLSGLPRSLSYIQCGTSPTFSITTVQASDLHLWVFGSKPSLLQNIFAHRGRRFLRRYYYSADFIGCLTALIPGLQTHHTWKLPTRSLGDTVWLVWADSCDPHYATVTSPPFEYTYVACPSGDPFVECSEDQNQLVQLATFQVLQMGDTIAGNDALRTGLTTFTADRTGLWRVSTYQNLLAGSSAAEGNVRIRKTSAPATTLAELHVSIPSNSHLPIQLAADVQLNAGEDVQVQFNVTVSSGYFIDNIADPNINVFSIV